MELNEMEHCAAETLRRNRPHWNVIEDDVKNVSFKEFSGRVNIVTGGFPCQAFSYAGKKLGLNDARGTLFYEFAKGYYKLLTWEISNTRYQYVKVFL